LVTKPLTNQEKLDQDFNNSNIEIERASEKELTRIREEITSLKDRTNKMSDLILGSSLK
jgi:hypothetical protein